MCVCVCVSVWKASVSIHKSPREAFKCMIIILIKHNSSTSLPISLWWWRMLKRRISDWLFRWIVWWYRLFAIEIIGILFSFSFLIFFFFILFSIFHFFFVFVGQKIRLSFIKNPQMENERERERERGVADTWFGWILVLPFSHLHSLSNFPKEFRDGWKKKNLFFFGEKMGSNFFSDLFFSTFVANDLIHHFESNAIVRKEARSIQFDLKWTSSFFVLWTIKKDHCEHWSLFKHFVLEFQKFSFESSSNGPECRTEATKKKMREEKMFKWILEWKKSREKKIQ